jgi:hypothetical protein
MAKIKVNCAWCGKELKRYPSHVSAANFCNKSCKQSWMKGRDTPNKSTTKFVDVQCSYCSKNIKKKKSQVKDGQTVFYCNRDCRSLHFKVQMAELKRENTSSIPCSFCGNEITATQDRFKYSENHFCGRSCYYKFKQKRITVICQECGKEFIQIGSRPVKFCSRTCYDTNRTNTRSIYISTCKYCGEAIKKIGHKAAFVHENGGKRLRLYCGKQCADLDRIGKYIGSDSPQWKGDKTALQDLIRKSAGYIRTRDCCFERDGYCSVLSGEGGQLVHHHLVSMSSLIDWFDLTKKNWRDFKNILFDINNTVTLTKKEHKLFHQLYGNSSGLEDFIDFESKFQTRLLDNSSRTMEE